MSDKHTCEEIEQQAMKALLIEVKRLRADVEELKRRADRAERK